MHDKGLSFIREQLANTTKPLKNIPFSVVIEAITGRKVLAFDRKSSEDQSLLALLIKAAEIAGKNVNKNGIKRSRPNEVGNDMEKFVKDALKEDGIEAYSPKTAQGKGKSTGYPDIEFIDVHRRVNYLECKVFTGKVESSTMRSFYLSPSEKPKVTADAHHFIVAYQIYVSDTAGTDKIYKCKKFKIISIENLLVDVKYEFNSDNRRLYDECLLLAEKTIL